MQETEESIGDSCTWSRFISINPGESGGGLALSQCLRRSSEQISHAAAHQEYFGSSSVPFSMSNFATRTVSNPTSTKLALGVGEEFAIPAVSWWRSM